MIDHALLSQVKKLRVAERIELVNELWASVDADSPPVTPAEAALVDQRLAEVDADPLARSSWDDVETSLRNRRP